MKKRIAAMLLAVSLLLTVPALAATDSTSNFTRSKTYSGEFSDLSERSVFYDNVVALYEYGLSVGKADGTFRLQDSSPMGQIIIFCRAHAVSTAPAAAEAGPSGYVTEGQAAYVPYLRYLQAEGVLGSELDGTYFSAATRPRWPTCWQIPCRRRPCPPSTTPW